MIASEHTQAPVRRGPAWGWRQDIRLAAVICAFEVVGTHFAARQHSGHTAIDVVGYLLVAAGPVALVFRRRAPGAVLLAVFGATALYAMLGYADGPIFISLVVAFFTAVAMGRRALAWSVLGFGYVTFLWLTYVAGARPAPTLGESVGLGAWLLVLLAVSEVVRARRERTLESWRIRTEESKRRASEERLRIAQELHDVLAHNISLINVQANVALHLLDEQPEQARPALTAIKQASKEALGELRSVLDILRAEDEEAPRAPAAGLDHLDGLVARTEAAGLPVRTEIEGTRRALPAGVDLAAYRIVQEALTNVTRHAGEATATVRIAYGEDAVTVVVDDDGRGAPAVTAPNGGNGIPGMRERATALGGALEAGPRPGGGFRVRARLPVNGGP